jgi:hypothetical protein
MKRNSEYLKSVQYQFSAPAETTSSAYTAYTYSVTPSFGKSDGSAESLPGPSRLAMTKAYFTSLRKKSGNTHNIFVPYLGRPKNTHNIFGPYLGRLKNTYNIFVPYLGGSKIHTTFWSLPRQAHKHIRHICPLPRQAQKHARHLALRTRSRRNNNSHPTIYIMYN